MNTNWSEMSTGKRILFVLGWICAAAYFILGVLQLFDILENARSISNALFGIWCLGFGSVQASKKTRVLWYVLAAVHFLFCLLWFFTG